MVVRLLLFILAVTFLPIGIIFGVIGLVADDVDRGEPEAFVYLGAVFTAVGLALALVFGVLQRREVARRRRRRAGLRASAEVVSARLNYNVRSGPRVSLNLTVRFPTAGTPDGTASTKLLVHPTSAPAEGEWIEILYDPTEPSNYEPILQT